MKQPNHKRFLYSLNTAMKQIHHDAVHYGYFDEKEFQAIFQVIKVYKEHLESKTPKHSQEPFYETVPQINESWCDYDKQIASIHMACLGQIFIDRMTKRPLDLEDELSFIQSITAKE